MSRPISATTGIGLRSKHVADFLALRPALGFVEVHTENHLCGGAMRRVLHNVRADYDISFHCVGLSIGSAGDLDRRHLLSVRTLIDEIDPFLVSDHLSVSMLGGVYTNDLLPLPYTEESLSLVCCHIETIQESLGRQILIENPSRYFAYRHSTISEGAFIAELVAKTGCGLLLDVNNVYVTACNMGEDPLSAMREFPAEAVKEMHLAGHDTIVEAGETLRIDTHDRIVCDDVWRLFGVATELVGRAPTLIEWDDDLPELDVLLGEATKAARFLRNEKVLVDAVAR